jgi:nitrogen fixation/metabolism regulation signal transduction histidine kinase
MLTLQEILLAFKSHTSWWVALLVFLSLIIEITPIKLNPWSWLAKKIGKAFNGEVMKEIGTIKTEVKDIKKDVSDIREEAKEREATNRRSRILEFGDEILHDVDYSKEHWDSILMDCSEYENYCDDHPHYMNNVAKATIKHIKHMYDKHLEEDSFL